MIPICTGIIISASKSASRNGYLNYPSTTIVVSLRVSSRRIWENSGYRRLCEGFRQLGPEDAKWSAENKEPVMVDTRFHGKSTGCTPFSLSSCLIVVQVPLGLLPVRYPRRIRRTLEELPRSPDGTHEQALGSTNETNRE